MEPMETSVDPMRVSRLNVFPIKSCRPVHVEEIDIDSFGVVSDRRFMVVDGSGRFVSQRKHSILATVTATYVNEQGKKLLCVSAPSMDWILKHEPILEGERMDASLWESDIRVIDQGETPAKWFNELFGHSSTFFRLVASAESCTSSEQYHRSIVNMPPVLKKKLPSKDICLADSGPISLISHESLSDLNERMKQRGLEEVPLIRFRMNIEIEGNAKPYEEDEWLVIRIGSVPFLLYKNSERCKMTGFDQETGEQDKVGPLEILRTYRAPDGPAHARFGQLCIALHNSGKVRVGNTVEVIERKKKGW